MEFSISNLSRKMKFHLSTMNTFLKRIKTKQNKTNEQKKTTLLRQHLHIPFPAWRDCGMGGVKGWYTVLPFTSQ